MLPSCQGADEHDQRRFGQMEIGDKVIENLEFITGIDKYLRIRASGVNDALFVSRGLYCPAAGRADADHTVAVSFRVIYLFRFFGQDLVKLAVHMVNY